MAQPCRVHLEHLAMATQFEIVLYGTNERYLSTVAEEVMREIDRLEAQLSFYRADSDIRQINAQAAQHPVSLDPRVFHLLVKARELNAVTAGAFDITVAPLIRCWGFAGGSGQMPSEDAIAKARAVVGMEHVILDAENYTIAFDREGVEIELGAIGKGYAIDQAVSLLREYEIESALLHGGTSAVYALGAPPDAEHWQVAIQKPVTSNNVPVENNVADAVSKEGNYLAVVEMRDEALSVSAPHGKWFMSEGRRYGHVIDPRTGYPTSRSVLAAIVMPSATDGDALSTGLLNVGAAFLPALKAYCPDARALVAVEETEGVVQTHSMRMRLFQGTL